MLTPLTIANIFRSIAQRHSESNEFQIQSFAVLDEFADLEAANFGRTIQDAQFGTYWRRRTITEDDNGGDFPLLYLVLESTRYNKGKVYYNYLVGTALPINCCEVKEKSDLAALNLLTSVLEELFNYGGYKNGNDLEYHPKSESPVGLPKYIEMVNLVQGADNASITSTPKTSKNLAGRITNITFNGCVDSPDTFEPYTGTDEYNITPKCETCL